MLRPSVLSLAMLAFGAQVPASAAEPGYGVSAPITHENLTIYFIRGDSRPGPTPLTLQEALAKQSVVVYETSRVEELFVENRGAEEVYIQSGDIVKGGQQDRVLTVSLILPPRSGRISIASFCVEQGRWSRRGQEDAGRFSSAESALPSRDAKLAMKAPPEALAQPAPSRRAGGGGAGAYGGAGGRGVAADEGAARSFSRQGAMWDSVSRTQQDLARNLGAPVAAPQSQSSLQLSLENEALKKAQEAYVDAFRTVGATEGDVVGYVFAINGVLNSADVYPSNDLFKKLWPKLLNASVTEAIGARDRPNAAAPSVEDVNAFLRTAAEGRSSRRALTAGISLETRDAERALYFETTRAGGWVHRNYLAK